MPQSGSMRGSHRISYKPDSMSTDEYIVIIGDADALKKWQGGDKTIPLVEIVDSFDVFHTGQGTQGVLNRASKQQLDTIFGTVRDTEVVEKILNDGRLLAGDAPIKYGSRNDNSAGFTGGKGAHTGGR